jgi:hypothetical protein
MRAHARACGVCAHAGDSEGGERDGHAQHRQALSLSLSLRLPAGRRLAPLLPGRPGHGPRLQTPVDQMRG